MSTKAQVKTQAKTPAAPRAARIPQPRAAELEREADQPDITTQLEGAARLGHSLRAISVRSAPPSQIQAMLPIQRQDLPEDDEEEVQMKRQPPAIQRQDLPEEDEEEELQMKPESAAAQRQYQGEGFRLDDETASRINRARGGGQPLERAIEVQMGEAMGHDFSGVRVHTDSEADALNRQLSAKAFTTGADIFFGRGAYEPGSSSGRELIAHELTHVVQQGTGRVQGGGSGVTVGPEGDSFEQEAESAARLLRTQHGGRDLDRHHMSARQTTEDRTRHRSMLSQPRHIDRSYGPTAQRDCWLMEDYQVGSFMEGADVEHSGEADNPNQVYWRLQPEPEATNSCFFAPVTDDGPDVWAIAEDGLVTPNERAQLAVLRGWVPEWHFLVLYSVMSPALYRAYWGITGAQQAEGGEVYQGGAHQVVFHKDRVAEILAIVLVEEEET